LHNFFNTVHETLAGKKIEFLWSPQGKIKQPPAERYELPPAQKSFSGSNMVVRFQWNKYRPAEKHTLTERCWRFMRCGGGGGPPPVCKIDVAGQDLRGDGGNQKNRREANGTKAGRRDETEAPQSRTCGRRNARNCGSRTAALRRRRCAT
jgi:hypothetical protein